MKSKFIEEMRKKSSAIHNFSIVYDIAIKSQWVNVEDDLPGIEGNKILIQYKDGCIQCVHCDLLSIEYFEYRSKTVNPIVRWMRVPDHD